MNQITGSDNETCRSQERLPIAETQPPSMVVGISAGPVVLGNGTLLLLLVAYIFGVLSWWSVLIAAALVAAGAVVHYRRQEARARAKYVGPRAAELGRSGSELARAKDEWEALLAQTTMFRGVAVPGFAISFILFLLILGDVAGALAGWPWLLRWSVALPIAVAGWAALLKLWAAANATPSPASFDFSRAREKEARDRQMNPEDRNDIQIIQQMSVLESLHKRIDAYTIESALLSALSFSAFISVTLAGRATIDDMHALFPVRFVWHPLPAWLRPLEALDIGSYPLLPSGYIDAHLVGLICLALLLCASTFLGVLVARLKFNDGYRDADCMLRTAQCLDDKEDAAFQSREMARGGDFSARIEELLRDARALQKGLNMTIIHMRWSRHAGMFCFVVALVLCGLFFTEWVAALIALMFIGALLVGYSEELMRGLLHRRLWSGWRGLMD